MRSRVLLALAVLAATTLPAHADPPTFAGHLLCGLASWNDPTGLVNPDWTVQTGVIHAEAVVADLPEVTSTNPLDVHWDYDGNPATGTVTCSIQINKSQHSDTDDATVSSTGTGVVALASTVSYRADQFDNVYVCTRWTLTDAHGASITWYWDDPYGWTTYPGASCTLAISVGHTYWTV